MADKIVIELELDPSLSKKGKKEIESQAAKSGKKAGKEFEDGFKKETIGLANVVKGSLKGVAGAIGAIAIGSIFKEGIRLAGIQEDAVNRLNTALKVSGDFTKQQSLDLQIFASNLQKVTRFGDEVILNQLALAKSFGATNDQAKEIVKAATDLAGALGIDLESATRNVAKTLGGYAGELGEVIPALKSLTKEQLQAGEGISALSRQFAGTASERAKSFQGQVDQLGNAFGDTLEEIGFFITKNETLLGLLEDGVSVLSDFGGGLRVIRKEFLGIGESESNEPIDKINKSLGSLANQINVLVDRQKSLRKGLFGFTFEEDRRQADLLTGKIQALRNQRRDLLQERAEILNQRKNQDKEESDSDDEKTKTILSNQQLVAQAGITSEALIVENAFARFAALDALRERGLLSETEYQAQLVEIDRQTNEQRLELIRQREAKEIEASGNIANATGFAFRNIQASTVKLGESLKTLAVQGYGRAFKEIGRALAAGESVNEAFVASTKATAGQAASAIADYYILDGAGRIAKSYGADATGYKMLAVGGGLKILAGALAGGGAGTSVGSSGAVGAGGGFAGDTAASLNDTTALEEQTVEREAPQTNVNVAVEGSLVQQEELGTFLAETLSESFGKQGVALTDARFT